MTPTCEEHGHSWSLWWGRDAMNPAPDGFNYSRECTVMGCTAKQRSRALEPVGDAPVTEERGPRD